MNAKRNIRAISETIHQLETGKFNEDQIRVFLADPSPLVRVTAMNALVEQFGSSPDTVRILEEAVHETRNRGIVLMGRATVAFEAVRLLLNLDTTVADDAVKRVVEHFAASERRDLISYLQNEPRAKKLGLV
jgi:hypothetical protein